MLLFLLAFGVLLARPSAGLMALATSPTLAGTAVRRQLPLTLVLLFIGGWLRLTGQRTGLYGQPSACASLLC